VCDGEDDSDSIWSFSEKSGLSVSLRTRSEAFRKRAAVAHLKSWQLVLLDIQYPTLGHTMVCLT
jgi:hypothetical protein